MTPRSVQEVLFRRSTEENGAEPKALARVPSEPVAAGPSRYAASEVESWESWRRFVALNGATDKEPVSVDHAGSELRWKFNTASGDVAFSVRFRPFRNTADGEKETRDLVVAKRLPSSNSEPHRGRLCCNEPGTYELVFDNSFSWLTRKELSYSVELLPSDAQRKKPDDVAREVKD
ncbi:hypothetical protein HPB51_015861 [Rhipicephalus microplus]|uniref:GOLD domain-containing protein n=1 Tax=Rhipicephalus microplus TaxID=6941 RepID=A0A9J6DHW1_RHIMP|nr:hypothetical protein HPB51_015861 [Rhipicephalus microplus]